MLEETNALEPTGQTYKDFVITKYTKLDELQSALVELVHVPTGARVTHIANDDPENLFCLSFQTIPYSSNGIAHILEHTVLCGSEKFPVKDPFFAMTRRSLNTYMNALTGQDFTCYPAASQVKKDFYNLLEVYMDAVFYPQLKHTSFLQEGHRLELVDPQDPMGELKYQGVVYNEMKGAMSSIDSRLWEALAKKLLPDLTYAHNSGGNPKEIPNLSYQELIDFHKEYYHPSRCLFFFYGNIPLAKHLEAIEPVLARA
jgi:Zn-dependent M16 (insulinase) family peptidase